MNILKGILYIVSGSILIVSFLEAISYIVNGWGYGSTGEKRKIICYSLIGLGLGILTATFILL